MLEVLAPLVTFICKQQEWFNQVQQKRRVEVLVPLAALTFVVVRQRLSACASGFYPLALQTADSHASSVADVMCAGSLGAVLCNADLGAVLCNADLGVLGATWLGMADFGVL